MFHVVQSTDFCVAIWTASEEGTPIFGEYLPTDPDTMFYLVHSYSDLRYPSCVRLVLKSSNNFSVS